MPLANGKILITGAAGLVGSHIAMAFSAAGFSLRGTTRTQEKADLWSAMHPEVDIEWVIIPEIATPGCYDEAVKGCVGAVNVATPVHFLSKTPEEIIVPAREGILNLLKAAVNEPLIKRIVFTGSIAAVQNNEPEVGVDPGTTYSHYTWNPATIESCAGKDAGYWYCASKTISEQSAWAWMDENKPAFDFCSICPASGYGLPLHPYKSFDDLDHATKRLWYYISGQAKYVPEQPYPTYTALVDVASCHLRAMLYPVAGGQRYFAVGEHYTYHRVLAILKEKLPEEAWRFPPFEGNGLPFPPHFDTDSSKIEKDLGMRWRPFEETIVEEAKFLYALEAKLNKVNGTKA